MFHAREGDVTNSTNVIVTLSGDSRNLSRVFLFHFEKILGHFGLFRVFWDVLVNTSQNSRFGQHEVCA